MYYTERLSASEISRRLGDRWWKPKPYKSLTSVKPFLTEEICEHCGGVLELKLMSNRDLDKISVSCRNCGHNNTTDCRCPECSRQIRERSDKQFNAFYDDNIVPKEYYTGIKYLENFTFLKLISNKEGIVYFGKLGLLYNDIMMCSHMGEFIGDMIKSNLLYPTKSSKEHITIKSDGSWSYAPMHCSFHINLSDDDLSELFTGPLDNTIVSMITSSTISKLLTDYTIHLGDTLKVSFDDYSELNKLLNYYVAEDIQLSDITSIMTIGNWVQCIYYTIRSMTVQQVRYNSKSTLDNFKNFLVSKLTSIPEKTNYNLPSNVKVPKLLTLLLEEYYNYKEDIIDFNSILNSMDNYECEDLNDWEEFSLLLQCLKEALSENMSIKDIVKLLNISTPIYFLMIGILDGLVIPEDKGVTVIMELVRANKKSK